MSGSWRWNEGARHRREKGRLCARLLSSWLIVIRADCDLPLIALFWIFEDLSLSPHVYFICFSRFFQDFFKIFSWCSFFEVPRRNDGNCELKKWWFSAGSWTRSSSAGDQKDLHRKLSYFLVLLIITSYNTNGECVDVCFTTTSGYTRIIAFWTVYV